MVNYLIDFLYTGSYYHFNVVVAGKSNLPVDMPVMVIMYLKQDC